MLRLAVYEPDIAQNLGTMIRTCACLDVPIDVIGPCGFPFSIKALRRSAMDYADQATIVHHTSWAAFQSTAAERRIVLATTKAARAFWDFDFRPGDTVLVGRESAGVPQAVHDATPDRIKIPMAEGRRSLNVAVSAGMILGEACRQLR